MPEFSDQYFNDDDELDYTQEEIDTIALAAAQEAADDDRAVEEWERGRAVVVVCDEGILEPF